MSSTVYQILEEIRNRLATIDLDSGFNTDAGARVYLGKRHPTPDEIDVGPVLQVYSTDDEPQDPDQFCDPMMIRVSVTVEGFARAIDSDFTLAAHDLIQDVKSAALIIGSETLGGLALDFGYSGYSIEYPDSGGDTVMVSLNFSALYEETFGAP